MDVKCTGLSLQTMTDKMMKQKQIKNLFKNISLENCGNKTQLRTKPTKMDCSQNILKWTSTDKTRFKKYNADKRVIKKDL